MTLGKHDLAERAAMIAADLCCHSERVCAACWRDGDRIAAEQEKARLEAFTRQGEQMALFSGGRAVVGGE